MTTKNTNLISYDPSGVFLDDTGVSPADLQALTPQLNAARTKVLDEDLRLLAEGIVPPNKAPLDAAFLELPERILAEYRADQSGSELGKILQTARRLQNAVDRVVVLGIGGSYMGARALLEACCEPYFNELDRGQRGSRPRMYFEGNNVDNDASQGLLKLLGNGRVAERVEDRWAIVVISKSGATLETAVALRQFLAALKSSLGSNSEKLAELVVPVTGDRGKLFDLAVALGCQEQFRVPDGVGGRFSVLSAVQPPSGKSLRGDDPRAERLVQSTGSGRFVVRPVAGRKPGQGSTGSHAHHGREYARSALPSPAAPAGAEGQVVHQPDRRQLAVRPAAGGAQRSGPGFAQRPGRQDLARNHDRCYRGHQ